MSKTSGEGRSDAEKAQRIIDPHRRERREAMRQEERDWADRSGPVTIRRRPVGDEE